MCTTHSTRALLATLIAIIRPVRIPQLNRDTATLNFITEVRNNNPRGSGTSTSTPLLTLLLIAAIRDTPAL